MTAAWFIHLFIFFVDSHTVPCTTHALLEVPNTGSTYSRTKTSSAWRSWPTDARTARDVREVMCAASVGGNGRARAVSV